MPATQLPEGVCFLPGGLVLDDGRRLGRAELRPLTGREEEYVAQHAETPSASMTTRILSACFMRLENEPVNQDLIGRLLVGDRDFLMLQLRRMTLGNRFEAVFSCPACKRAMDVDFSADDISIEPRPQNTAVYEWQRDDLKPPVRFRLPTGVDQEAIVDFSTREAVDSLLTRCVIDDGGVPLTSEERASVIDEMDRLAPQIDLELDLNCPECEYSFTTPFDCTAFFFSEIRAQSRHLMREVHYLALHYHWSEAEILGLQRERRRGYLTLLNETLRPN